MRPIRAPRGRGRGGMIRGSSIRGAPGRGTSFSRGRGAPSHYVQKRGSFSSPIIGRTIKRTFNEANPSRSSYDHQSNSSRNYEPAEKYYSYESPSSSRGSFKPKYQKYQSESSSYHHRSPSPRRRSHSGNYESEAPSHRSSSSHYRDDYQEERYERSQERYEEHRSEQRYQSSRDSYMEEAGEEPLEPPPPPLISENEEYQPAPKEVPQRGRGALRGVKRAPYRSYGATTMGSSQKTALLAKKKLALATGRTFKRPTYTKNVRPRVFEVDAECPERDTDPDAKDEDDGDTRHAKHRPPQVPHTRSGYKYIPLHCPHCRLSCTTFQQYSIHLTKKRHIMAMVKVDADIKQRVISMRSQQRRQQNKEENNPDPEQPLTEFTSFCPTCKLNYRQSKEVHESSKMHLEIKQFLFPTCYTCNIKFRSARFYEQHICSLDHIRNAAAKKDLKKRDRKDDADEVGEIDQEAFGCLEGFMVVDAVGEDDDDDTDEAEKMEELCGVDRIKSVEALFCELCQRFLPRLDDVDKAKSVHCRSSLHKKNFEDDDKNKVRPARKAEDVIKTEKDDDKVHIKIEKLEPVEEQAEPEEEKDDIVDDEAIWRDVDRDIGELLKDRNDDTNSNISNEDVQLSPSN